MGFISTLLGWLFLPLGLIVNNANLLLLWIAHTVVMKIADFPFALFYLSSPKLPLLIGYYICLVYLLEALKSNRKPEIDRYKGVLIGLVAVSILVWNFALSDFRSGLRIGYRTR
jgi:hypothetical protein